MSFIDELKRRNVIRVGGAYVLVGWAIAQVAEFAFENFGAPDWLLKSFVVILFLGLPVALIFAWAFEMTPEGLKRERDVERSESITAHTGRKLDRLIIIGLIVCIAVLLVDRFLPSGSELEPDAASVDAVETGEAVVDEPVQPDRSIAVLPFVNMTDDKDYFADGLSEELLNLLAKIPDLKVAGRTSSFMFKGKNDDLRAIGESLGVAHVLEGSVRRSGEKLRITAQLIKVEDGFHLWSETYDREMADIFDIQDDVAAHIAEQLELQLIPDAERGTIDVEAYALYLEANAILYNPFESDWLLKIANKVNQATELDKNFAKPWAVLAQAYWFASGTEITSREGQKLTYQAALKALEIDPDLPVAKSFAVTASPNWTWAAEIEALERYLREDPIYDVVGGAEPLAYGLVSTGYLQEAFRVASHMIEMEPLLVSGHMRMGDTLGALGRTEEAIRSWRIAAEKGSYFAYVNAIQYLVLKNRDQEAVEFSHDFEFPEMVIPQDLKGFLLQARNSVAGKDYLKAIIKRMVNDADIVQEKAVAYGWLLVLGEIDEYWQAMKLMDGPGDDWVGAGWSDADLMAFRGMIMNGSGFAASPDYLTFAQAASIVGVWDSRGPPDHCQKVDGKWVCR